MLSQGKIKAFRLSLSGLLCGALLWLAWPPHYLINFIVFIAFVPLLALESNIAKYHNARGKKIFFLAYFTFLCWNVFTTWWVWYASGPGAIAAIVLNTLLMTIPFWLFTRVKRRAGKTLGYISLVCFWLCLEMLHLNWDAPWPWLNLGNVFSALPSWIQWYEYTGALGGTVWVWVVNILVYEFWVAKPVEKKWSPRRKMFLTASLLCIILPIVISFRVSVKGHPRLPLGPNIVAVQPNIDPYSEKFDPATFAEQINTLLELTNKTIDSNTIIVAWPETAIAEEINEEAINNNPSVAHIQEFLAKHPKITLITGINSYKTYPLSGLHSNTARLLPSKEAWYDIYNAAVKMGHGQQMEFYHKSKLVPGVEKMPYPGLLSFMERFAISEGGTSGSLGSQDTPTVFKINDTLKVCPVICYESIFGAHVGRFVKKGADIITIITNDGWWYESPGYKQHLSYATLRAIETRRFIARAANTGVSCFIWPSGEIFDQTEYGKPAAIKSALFINHQITFYTRYGDYIGWAGVCAGIGFLIFLLSSLFIRSQKREKLSESSRK